MESSEQGPPGDVFEESVQEALDSLPPDLCAAISNVIRHVVLHELAHHFGISDERSIEIDRY